ncbi:MAG: HAMP domain-containing histidine kinase [Candidatus Obscuribacterales bacterium]|nr:HAMP domain-containing histidine kinase [Candidatus Obscuribacterales bacterium]
MKEQANKDASIQVAEAAHELRLPIANIKLLLETLLDGALEDKDTSRRMLKRAYQEADRLQVLVQDMLCLEPVAARRQTLKCKWLSLAEKIEYAIESVSRLSKEKDLRIVVEVASDFRIYANSQQFDQVLVNLLENAVKFSEPGGCVKIKAGPERGTFSIQDEGIGMAEQEIPKIFSRFYRIDKSSSRAGTGLGLSIVKQVLDLHDAKIQVQSQEGSGSCFRLEFPEP